jgi:hypothetical protein
MLPPHALLATDVVLNRTLTKMIVVILLILQGTLAQLSGKQHGALMVLYDALGTQHRTRPRVVDITLRTRL